MAWEHPQPFSHSRSLLGLPTLILPGLEQLLSEMGEAMKKGRRWQRVALERFLQKEGDLRQISAERELVQKRVKGSKCSLNFCLIHM